MTFCFHKYGEWGKMFNSTVVRPKGNFGDKSTDNVVMQERECIKCKKIDARIIREGKMDESV